MIFQKRLCREWVCRILNQSGAENQSCLMIKQIDLIKQFEFLKKPDLMETV